MVIKMVDRNRLKNFDSSQNGKNLNIFANRINEELKSMAPVIAIEELSELIQATSKWMRFDRPGTNNTRIKIEEDKIHLTEEIADATIALHIIKNMAKISNNDIEQMIAYKLDRKRKFLDNGTIINKTESGRKRPHKKR